MIHPPAWRQCQGGESQLKIIVFFVWEHKEAAGIDYAGSLFH